MIVLPKIWSKTTIHKIYQEESPDPKVNKKYFFTLFRKTVGARRIDKSLPHIRISKYSTHSKCNVCVDLMKERERIKTEEDKIRIESKVNAHRKKFGGARLVISRKMQHSISFPEDSLFIAIDDMDNSKSLIPRIIEGGKRLANLKKLDSKITGCILTNGKYEGNRKVKFLINHNEFENGPNKVIRVIFRLL